MAVLTAPGTVKAVIALAELGVGPGPGLEGLEQAVTARAKKTMPRTKALPYFMIQSPLEKNDICTGACGLPYAGWGKEQIYALKEAAGGKGRIQEKTISVPGGLNFQKKMHFFCEFFLSAAKQRIGLS
jgi:hypothetical protein